MGLVIAVRKEVLDFFAWRRYVWAGVGGVICCTIRVLGMGWLVWRSG